MQTIGHRALHGWRPGHESLSPSHQRIWQLVYVWIGSRSGCVLDDCLVRSLPTDEKGVSYHFMVVQSEAKQALYRDGRMNESIKYTYTYTYLSFIPHFY